MSAASDMSLDRATALGGDAPVCYRADGDVWLVRRHRDVLSVLRDARRYSAIALGADRAAARSPDDGQPLSAAQSLLASDPPVHTRLRRFVEPWLGAAERARHERAAHDALIARLDAVRPLGRCDVIAEICRPVGEAVLAAVFGGDTSLTVGVGRWMRVFSACNARSMNRETAAAIDRAHQEIWAAVQASRAPGLMTCLARAHAAGELTAASVVDLCGTLVQGGADTTSHLVGNALLALEEGNRLMSFRDRPETIGAFVEECLRRDAPVQMTIRTTTERVELGGVPIPAGSRVLLLLGAANLDESPGDASDAHCPRPKHVSFGAGAHRCPGAALARMEACMILQALASELDAVRVDVRSAVLAEQVALRGPDRLEISFTAMSPVAERRGPVSA